MKKKIISVIALLFITVFANYGFKIDNNYKITTFYGGTASVTVSYEMNLPGHQKGDSRVINVSVACLYSSSDGATSALQLEITEGIMIGEVTTSEINYNIQTCDM